MCDYGYLRMNGKCVAYYAFGEAARAYEEDGLEGLREAINDGEGYVMRKEYDTPEELEAYSDALYDAFSEAGYGYVGASAILADTDEVRKELDEML